jgi:hypothetical protein
VASKVRGALFFSPTPSRDILPGMSTQVPATRAFLAQVARREATLGLAGNAQMAGPAIERYLSVLREALNLNASTNKYSDPAVGFDWCGAFVYYCCLEAGFRFPPKPVPTYRYTLGAVPAWHHWAVTSGFFHPTGSTPPSPGDIALFNRVYDDHPLDHIGIVLEVTADGVQTAEGNNANRTGIFSRPFEVIEGFVRLPETAC